MHTTVGRVGILIRARIILLARVVILCIEYSSSSSSSTLDLL